MGKKVVEKKAVKEKAVKEKAVKEKADVENLHRPQAKGSNNAIPLRELLEKLKKKRLGENYVEEDVGQFELDAESIASPPKKKLKKKHVEKDDTAEQMELDKSETSPQHTDNDSNLDGNESDSEASPQHSDDESEANESEANESDSESEASPQHSDDGSQSENNDDFYTDSEASDDDLDLEADEDLYDFCEEINSYQPQPHDVSSESSHNVSLDGTNSNTLSADDQLLDEEYYCRGPIDKTMFSNGLCDYIQKTIGKHKINGTKLLIMNRYHVYYSSKYNIPIMTVHRTGYHLLQDPFEEEVRNVKAVTHFRHWRKDLSAETKRTFKCYGSRVIHRGHLVPKGDFRAYLRDKNETQYFENTAPMKNFFNGIDWFFVEEYCRKVAIQYIDQDSIILTGSIVDDFCSTVEGTKVFVPLKFWKVFAVQSAGKLCVFAFLVHHGSSSAISNARDWFVPYEDVEKACGFKLFPGVSKKEIISMEFDNNVYRIAISRLGVFHKKIGPLLNVELPPEMLVCYCCNIDLKSGNRYNISSTKYWICGTEYIAMKKKDGVSLSAADKLKKKLAENPRKKPTESRKAPTKFSEEGASCYCCGIDLSSPETKRNNISSTKYWICNADYSVLKKKKDVSLSAADALKKKLAENPRKKPTKPPAKFPEDGASCYCCGIDLSGRKKKRNNIPSTKYWICRADYTAMKRRPTLSAADALKKKLTKKPRKKPTKPPAKFPKGGASCYCCGIDLSPDGTRRKNISSTKYWICNTDYVTLKKKGTDIPLSAADALKKKLTKKPRNKPTRSPVKFPKGGASCYCCGIDLSDQVGRRYNISSTKYWICHADYQTLKKKKDVSLSAADALKKKSTKEHSR